jgi:hypothetical protein
VKRIVPPALLAQLLLVLAPPVLAAESYDGCTNFVTSLPATIPTPGTWCLTHDLSSAATFNVLEIAADDVVLDCSGFRIDGSPRAAGEYAVGIAAINRVRITVRNCQVRNFSEGIVVIAPQSTSGDHLIEDNLVSGVRAHSANPGGIRSNVNYGGHIRGNLVRGVVRTGTGDLLFGVYVTSGSVGATIRGNTVVGDGTPNTIGVLCDSTKVVLKDNLVEGFATNNYGCRDAGNVLKP